MPQSPSQFVWYERCLVPAPSNDIPEILKISR